MEFYSHYFREDCLRLTQVNSQCCESLYLFLVKHLTRLRDYPYFANKMFHREAEQMLFVHFDAQVLP